MVNASEKQSVIAETISKEEWYAVLFGDGQCNW
jgi:hypothetical protein